MLRYKLHTLLIAIAIPMLLNGCASRGIPLPAEPGEQAAARTLLEASARAHGGNSWAQIRDISVSYSGEWYGLVSRIQPVLIDPAFRQASEERILVAERPLVAQRHTAAGGYKQVLRSADRVSVAYNDKPSELRDVKAAAALVGDAYRMFLTGPFHFLSGNSQLALGEAESVDGRECDTVIAIRRPGHGFSDEDRYMLFIDRDNRLLRRVRFTMEGLDSTKGAIAEVDFFDHREIAGIVWPTRFYERLRKPIPGLSVHDWRLTGLDVNRGMKAEELSGPIFTGSASAPARALPAPEPSLKDGPASRAR
jgi:hypothetical protein